MRTALLVVCALMIVGGVAAVTSPTAPATTAPVVAFNVKVTITDEKVTFDRRTGPRGYFAVFIVRNLGSKPHRINIGGLTSRVLGPRQKTRIGANLEERGRFPYRVDGGGRGHSGYFTVT